MIIDNECNPLSKNTEGVILLNFLSKTQVNRFCIGVGAGQSLMGTGALFKTSKLFMNL